jgi:triacylglycerol esterase/lipase EstA (alpha/beta hydrolase family)
MKNKGIIRVLILTVLMFQGCGYINLISRQKVLESKIKTAPSVTLKKELNPDRCYTLYGTIKSALLDETPVAIAAFSFQYGKQELVDFHIMSGEGYYSLFLPEGQFFLYAFTDLNHNNRFEINECTGLYNDELVLSDSNYFSRVIGGIDLKISPRSTNVNLQPFDLTVPENFHASDSKPFPPGTLRTLDDPIFSKDVAIKGIFTPSEFLDIAPMYFYAITRWNEKKIPIVFVHGYGGHPKEFRYITEHIDTSKFQPWFFYYPSGQRLDRSGEVFFEIFLSGNIIKLRQQRIVIFAHSMGGLVARYALNRYSKKHPGEDQIDYISASTPYGGNIEAETAIKNMPAVIPAWLDLSAESPFIKNLNACKLSSNIRFSLFFSFKNNGSITMGQNSDGSIVLNSQLFPEAQKAAFDIMGFDATHEGILLCPEMIEKFNEILSGN